VKPISEVVGERPLYAITPHVTVTEAALYMVEKNIGALPVVEENRLVGIFTERDALVRVIAKGLNPGTTKISNVMTKAVVAAKANEDVESCLKKMKEFHCRHLPILSGEQLIGMVSIRDLASTVGDEKEVDADYLNAVLSILQRDPPKR
jgi:CBS domain-containing protein